MNRAIFKGLSCVFALVLVIFCVVTALGNEYEGLVNAALNVQTGSVSSISKDPMSTRRTSPTTASRATKGWKS